MVSRRVPTSSSRFLMATSFSCRADFAAATFDTSLIDEKLDSLIESQDLQADTVCAGISGLIASQRARLERESGGGAAAPGISVWQTGDGFQLVGNRELDWQFVMDGKEVSGRVRFGADGLQLADDGDWVSASSTAAAFEDDGKLYVLDRGRQSIFEQAQHLAVDESGGSSADGVVSVPMHGKIIAVTVADGDAVEQGDMLFAVEAMKMEHAVLAPHDGTVSDLAISAGEQVENGFPALKILAESA